MCKILEDMRNESEKRGEERRMKKTALCMLEDGRFTLEEIVKISGLPLDGVKKLKAEREV